jgi:stage II sporulation protein D
MRRLVLAVAACLLLAPPAGAVPVFVAKGRGWGHGIGMSQWGAQGFASHGWSYQRILAHYYRGTTLGRAETTKVRVLLAAGRKRFVVTSRRPFRIGSRHGKRVVLRPDYVAKHGPLRIVPGAAPLALDGVPYRGALVIRSNAGVMAAVNDVTLERYLRGVVPDEMPRDWHPEALKAQAVVARSYALATLKPGKNFDLRNDARSQVYNGVRAEEWQTNLAIGATAGRVLLWRGEVATTYYHSTSGGRTATIREAWPDAKALPYLRSVADPYDSASPHHRWGWMRLDLRKLGIRRPVDLRLARGPSGRATSFLLLTRAGLRHVDAGDARRALGLRSTWVQLGVLDLRRPGRSLAVRGKLELRGIARGLRAPVVQRLTRGSWQTVARVRPGAFRVRVAAVRGARYRVAAEGIKGPVVRLGRRAAG